MPLTNTPVRDASDSVNNNLPQPQKNAVIFLSIIGVLIIVGWIWQMRTQIRRPFVHKDTETSTSTVSSNYDNALKNRDTDGDGLSDYDEINVYHTSPYLEDSDSDGINDKQEIERGTDPNCPQGKNCSAPVESNPVIATSSISNGAAISLPSDLSSSGISTTTLQNALTGQVDAATLRQLLIAGGADKTELDKISDEDLMKSYQNTLSNQNQSSANQVKQPN